MELSRECGRIVHPAMLTIAPWFGNVPGVLWLCRLSVLHAQASFIMVVLAVASQADKGSQHSGEAE